MIHKDLKFKVEDGPQCVIDELTSLARSGGLVFRGYNKQDELLPALIREKDYSNVEQELLKDFERYGSHYFHATTAIDFMSYGQHFGLPTRLLDFTYNPFIALAFALYGPKSNGNYKEADDKTYYYIRYASLEDNLCVPTIPLYGEYYNSGFVRADSLATKSIQCIDSVTDLFGANNLRRGAWALNKSLNSIEREIFQKKIDKHTILFVDPNQSNQRIIMQQGLFMFPYVLDRNEHLNIIKQNSSVIMIHKGLREELLKYLDTLGFSTFRLMPDLASVCTAVKRKVIDERMDKGTPFKKREKLENHNNEEELVFQFLKENGSVTVSSISDKTGIGENFVRRYLHKLEQKGKVTKATSVRPTYWKSADE